MSLTTVTGKNAVGTVKTMIAAANGAGHLAAAAMAVDSDGAYITGRTAPDEMLKTYLLDGSSNDMTVNGASTPVIFKYTVPTGKKLYLARLMMYLEDNVAFDSDKFGGITALSTGVVIAADGNTWETWQDNIDITTCMFDTEGRANFAKEDKSLCGRWTFTKETGGATELAAGEIFSATVNDNLSGLAHFRIKIGGRLVDE